MFDPGTLSAFRNGDEKAFKDIFGLFHKRLCIFASGIADAEAADDIVQDAFIKLWERKENFDNIESIKAFLYLTIKNTCINVYKHQQVVNKHLETIIEGIDEINVSHRIIEAEVAYEVQQMVQKLPLGYRQVIYLSYFQEKSNQEVADLLHVSINTVKTQKARGMKILRAIFKRSLYVFLLLLVK